MYIHLGGDFVVNENNIIGIFDLEKTTVSKATRDFLSNAEKKKQVVNVSYELPKSFILTNKNNKNKVYISQISPNTLTKRQGIIVK
ncbi:MAG: DUF370 domain-containing protein [Clostridia bacterium]|nr:DUF370 domain-containing protein [Clostridia bacterium]